MRTTEERQGPASASAQKAKRKWLSRIGTFLVMGGWFLVAFFVLGVIILLSVLGAC